MHPVAMAHTRGFVSWVRWSIFSTCLELSLSVVVSVAVGGERFTSVPGQVDTHRFELLLLSCLRCGDLSCLVSSKEAPKLLVKGCSKTVGVPILLL